MASATQTWLGRFAIGSATDTIDLDDNGGNAPTVTLTSGDYWISCYTGEGANGLVEHITTKIQAEGGDFAGVTCSYSASTGKVSFVAGAGKDIDITFTDSALRTILGYAADITALDDTTQTAGNEARYTWRPDRGFASHPVERSNFWAPKSTTVVGRSKDGTTFAVRGNLLYEAEVSYVMLDDARVIIPSTGTVYQELQQFYADVIHNGEPIRIIFDDTAYAAATDYAVALVSSGAEDEPVPAWGDFANRHISNFNGLWDVTLPLVRYVS